jgi:uncharacterized protein
MVREGNAVARAFGHTVFSSQFRLRWGTTRPQERSCAPGSAAASPGQIPQPMTSNLNTTRIYVDADACPVKDEIYRVAARHGLPVSVVAGNFIRVPPEPLIERVAAGSGMDAADDWIAERAGKGDIVVTSDIPLASRCVKAGAEVIAPNGKPFTEQSIGMTLAVRNLMTDLRSSGEVTGGPRSFAPRDRSAFLSALDQTIRRIQRQRAGQAAQNQN